MKPFGNFRKFTRSFGASTINQISLPLKPGVAGNIQTVNLMRDVARFRANQPLINQIATAIPQQAGIRSHDYIGEAKAIGQWVWNNVRYVRDTADQERLQDPLMMVEMYHQGMMRGDCDDMTFLTATLLLSAGFTDVRFRCIRYNETSGPYAHIYLVVYEPVTPDIITPAQIVTAPNGGQFYRLPIDCILKNKPIGTELPHLSGDEYPL